MSFQASLPVILKLEGGYVNDPHDRGGATNQGITQGTYDKWRQAAGADTKDVAQIASSEVSDIYQEGYWKAGNCHRLAWPANLVQFDSCVNHGVRNATRILQRVIGTRDDGWWGAKTQAAVGEWGPLDLAYELLMERLRFYYAIVRNNSGQGRFLHGWVGRLTRLHAAMKDG